MTNLQNQHVLQSQWVYKIKCSADDQIICYKACWVVKKYEQQFDVNYNQIFVSVIKSQTYKALFVLVTHFNLKTDQMNIITVFLYSFINQIIYVKLLYNYQLSDKIVLLNKVLYDLKKSSHLWYKTLFNHLILLRFQCLELNHSIFLKNSIIITVYVNDLLLIDSSKSVIQCIKNKLNSVFNMTDLGSDTYYLSMWIKQNCIECTIYSTQTAYIHKILHTFHQNETNSVNISINSDIVFIKKFNKQTDVITICYYQWAINLLMYIMLQTHSDIVFTVFSVSQFT